ncbi:hypothetical protein E4U16_004414 [Claviceps sp. LM84 group G4]|nr:hypothetical protein E4U16_004414 [Claviceps sp. LM84 group G4]
MTPYTLIDNHRTTNQQDDRHNTANPLVSAWDSRSAAPTTADTANSHPRQHHLLTPWRTPPPIPAPPAPLAPPSPRPTASTTSGRSGTAIPIPNSFENWLFTIDITLGDPGMSPFLGTPAHICGALFACIPSVKQSECAAYIRARQRSHDGAPPPPFVVDDFVTALKIAFLPKDLATRAGKQIYL